MSNGTLSDFGSAFSNSGFNNGRQRYGNTMTHFSDDGRLVTNRDDVGYPNRNRRLPEIPDYRSYDAGRDRARRFERNRNDNWRDREIAREREREQRGRDFYNPPPPTTNHASHYPSRHYGGGVGTNPDYNHAPIYGRTLPLPLSRDVGPPVRRFDDYRTRELRPNYEKSDFNFDRPRNYDWRIPVTSNRYDQTGLVASKNYGGRYGVLATKHRSKWSSRPMGWFFVVDGILLLTAGLINLLLCLPNYYYCFMWMSVLTIVLGVVGVFHRGKYKKECVNMYYVANGSLLTVAAMVASGLTFSQYIPFVKDMAKVGNQTAYYIMLDALPTQPLIKTVATSTRLWVCIVWDSIGLMCVLADYLALYAVILVAHRYWNYKNQVGKSVEPYCSPRLFNPFMLLLWGELLVLVGLVSVFGCYGTEWYKYWSGVGAGLFIILTGIINSWAAKVTNRTSASALAIAFDLFGCAACIVVIVFCVLGVKEDIDKLNAGTDANNDWLIASSLIFAVVMAVAVICFFYCMGLLVRFSYYLTRSGYDRDAFTTSSRSEQTISTVRQRYGYDKDQGFDSSSDPPLPYRSPRHGFFSKRH